MKGRGVKARVEEPFWEGEIRGNKKVEKGKENGEREGLGILGRRKQREQLGK